MIFSGSRENIIFSNTPSIPLPQNSLISDEINPARSITANGPERHMHEGFAGLSFCMGKRRPKDISLVDVEGFLSDVAGVSALKRQKPPLSLALSPQAGRGGLVLHSLAIAVMQGKLGRYFALRLVRLGEARI